MNKLSSKFLSMEVAKAFIDAIVKYSSGITLNMEEIIIFCDQIIGYYPVDLKTFEQLQK